jgi:hypothetical protein
MLVRNLFESTTLMSVTTPAAAPDLAHVREQFPKLSRLRDAIRHAYWTEFLVPQCSANPITGTSPATDTSGHKNRQARYIHPIARR